MTRLSAAAFWLEVWEIDDIVCVTAAYTTITSRLGVVMTRLLAAAFWLGVRRIADIDRRKTDRRLNLAT
jgi:hypothetical protein